MRYNRWLDKEHSSLTRWDWCRGPIPRWLLRRGHYFHREGDHDGEWPNPMVEIDVEAERRWERELRAYELARRGGWGDDQMWRRRRDFDASCKQSRTGRRVSEDGEIFI